MNDASLDQNPNLCESDPCIQQTNNKQPDGDQQKNKNNIVIPVVASVAGVLVLLIIVAAAIICGLKRKKPQGKAVANYLFWFVSKF